MKKWIALFLLSSSFAIAQDMNAGIEERIYKTVVINGIEVKKWVIFDTFTQYNNEQKPIYQKGPNNTEIWWKYNSKGHIKSEERKNSGITIFECDDDGRIIHSRLDAAPEVKGIIGVDVWYEYNFNGLCIYRKEKINNSLTAEYTYEYTYWDNGKVKTCSRYRF